jgi:hypothetical protein
VGIKWECEYGELGYVRWCCWRLGIGIGIVEIFDGGSAS